MSKKKKVGVLTGCVIAVCATIISVMHKQAEKTSYTTDDIQISVIRQRSIYEKYFKRLFDVTCAMGAVVFLSPIYLVIAILVKLKMGSPILFTQDRPGMIDQDGTQTIFKMYKFRSMYIDAEERKKELMAKNEMNGLMFKMEDDPRITRVGKFLRRTSLDEFPQFINILKGDMSLVGTRPPTLDEFEQYKTYHKKRLSFRPGLTGMWQVSGRSDITDFEEIVRLDVEYINNWSVSLDIKILIKTVLAVFAESGAR